MTTARDQMKLIQRKLDEVREKILKLQIEEKVLANLLAEINGDAPASGAPKKRAIGVKPLVLDIMQRAGAWGATSAEVAVKVQEQAPDVAKDTVGSVLSRLKADGALTYNGERYYVKQMAPKEPTQENPFEVALRAVK